MSANTLKAAPLSPHSGVTAYPSSPLRTAAVLALPVSVHAKVGSARALTLSPVLVRVAHDLSTWLHTVAGVSVAPVDLQLQLQHSLQLGLGLVPQSHGAAAGASAAAPSAPPAPLDLVAPPDAALTGGGGDFDSSSSPVRYITSQAAARHLGVSRSHINALADEGQIKGVLRTPGGHRRLPLKAVLEFKQRQLDVASAVADAAAAASPAAPRLADSVPHARSARWPAGS